MVMITEFVHWLQEVHNRL